MTNFKTNLRLEAILNQVFELLDEKNLSRLIDEPVDQEATLFQCDASGEITHALFIKLIGQFVRNIYKKASFQNLSRSHAEVEAMALIENGYPNTCDDGYNAAYLDAKDDIVTVLLHIAEIIKNEMRSNYVRWVYSHHIDPLNWQLKRELVDTIRNRWPFLPPRMQRLSSCQLANHIDELILAVISTKHAVQGWLRTGDDQFT